MAGREPPREGDEPYMRDGRPRCRGHHRATGRGKGRQCPRPALPGLTVCAKHGGGSPAARAKSERYRKEQVLAKAVVRFGLRRDVTPAEALLEEVQYLSGTCQWLRETIDRELLQQPPEDADGQLGDWPSEPWRKLVEGVQRREEKDDSKGHSTTEVTGPGVHPLWELYERAQDRLVKASAAALAAGVAERQVRLAESQGLMVAAAVRGILGGMLAGLRAQGLTPELEAAWVKLVPVVVPEQLRALSAASPTGTTAAG